MTGVNQGTGGTGWLPGHRGNPGEGSAVVGGLTVPAVVDGGFDDPDGVADDTVDLTPVSFDAGDIMFLLVAGAAQTALETPPPGWENSNIAESGVYLYSRRMAGNETTVILSEPTTARRTLAAVRNVDPEVPLGYYVDSTTASGNVAQVNHSNMASSTDHTADLFPQDYTMLLIGTNTSDAPITAGGTGDIAADAYDPVLQFVNGSTGKGGFIASVTQADQKVPSGRRRMGVTLGELTSAGTAVVQVAVGAPRTPAFKAAPQIIGQRIFGTTSPTVAANLPKHPNVLPGDLQIWFLGPYVWSTVSGGSGFDRVENAEILGYEAVFPSSPSATVTAVYDESHGDSYAVSGVANPDSAFSRYVTSVRVINHGGVFDSRRGDMVFENGTANDFPTPPIGLAADVNDLIVVGGSARAALDGLVLTSNPDEFELISTTALTAGGAGSSLALVKKTITAQDGAGTFTVPTFDHANTANDTVSWRVGHVVVRPALVPNQQVVGVTEDILVELNAVPVATVSESTTFPVVRLSDSITSFGILGRITATTISETETVPSVAATITDGRSETTVVALTISETETAPSGAATITDDQTLGLS